MKQYNIVTVEGNTGAGKTSLAKMLAKEFDANIILEDYVDNPFLPRFYAEPKRYAFHTEVFFFLDRLEQLQNLHRAKQLSQGLNITDYLFNKSLLYAEVNLDKEEYQLFARLFHQLHKNLPSSELIIYVHSTVPRLMKNIQKRGRGFEQQVQQEYLQSVEDLYLNYFSTQPKLTVLIIHADELDFVDRPADYQRILNWVQQDYEPGIHHLNK